MTPYGFMADFRKPFLLNNKDWGFKANKIKFKYVIYKNEEAFESENSEHEYLQVHIPVVWI